MSGMEVDSSLEPKNLLSQQDRILQRLLLCGVPVEKLDQLQSGLVAFVKENKSLLPELVSAILPTDEEVVDAPQEARGEPGGALKGPTIKSQFGENILWLHWLMFEHEPHASLENLAKMSAGQRGVCGTVWRRNDIAYRCKTCENDPTCAICIPCFQNGNHKDHDYSIMYTGGGCCDCGDVTAFKREGFCSKHNGREQIQPLPEEIANSVGPVLDALLICWKDKLLIVETILLGSPRADDRIDECKKVANMLTLLVVEMLLEFCNYSESLITFVCRRVYLSVGLMDILVRVERFLGSLVVRKLHELLLKFLAEPIFKYEFAKVYINYYPVIINEAIKECSDDIIEKYTILSTFSVQIFTVPTLTARLVEERNLLGILLGCLGDLFLSCAGGDGHLQKWGSLHQTTLRLVHDIRFVMRHVEVPKYIIREQPDVAKTWMRLLAFVQGMNPQKRVIGLPIEQENENMQMPFLLEHFIACINSLLVEGAFTVDDAEYLFDIDKQDLDNIDNLRHPKVGRFSQESSVCSMTGSTTLDCTSKDVEVKVGTGSHPLVPCSVSWLMYECLKVIENWLRLNVTSGHPLNPLCPGTSRNTGSSFSVLKKTLSKIRKGKNICTPSDGSRLTTSSELHGGHGSSSFYSGFSMRSDVESKQTSMVIQDDSLTVTGEMDLERASGTGDFNGSILEVDCATESEALHVLSLSDWPCIIYDVSSQDICLHIPLHRLLSTMLQKALRRCYGESAATEMTNATSAFSLSRQYLDFFGQVLGGCHPYGFAAFVMEHPLRIRVFSAQVRAGMWRKNGDAAMLSCELYRSVRWSEQFLQLDLFLLQCCAALAPPDLYVKRIQECFGLSNYLSLNLERPDEYEPVLLQEMLTLIIQIVKERRFCGLSMAESLQRELVYKLAIGDATHSQLVKSLPHDLSKNKQLQNILDVVAVYSSPSGMKQGKYSLRKTYWEELDLYHPRWNSRELQIAEDRYLHFCKVSALTNQLPRWSKVFHPFHRVAGIATSKAVFEIVRAVLFYAVFMDNRSASPSRASDGVLLTALHLLSLALEICYLQRQSNAQSGMTSSSHVGDSLPVLAFAREEIDVGAPKGLDAWRHQSMLSLLVSLMRMLQKESLSSFMEAGHCNLFSLIEGLLKKMAELDSDCMNELQRIAPEVVCHFSQSIPHIDGQILGSASEAEDRKARARERQVSILAKMKAAQYKFMANFNSTENDSLVDSKSEQEINVPNDGYVSEESAPVCSFCRDPDSKSPVSFLILLQKSRLVSIVERGPPSWELVLQSSKEHPSITTNNVTSPFETTTVSCSSEMISSSHLVQLIQNAVDEFVHNDGLPSEVDAFLDFIKVHLPAVRNFHLSSTSYDTSMNTAFSFEMMEEDLYRSIQRDMHDILLHTNSINDDQNFPTTFAGEHFTRSRNAESALLGKYIASLPRETSEHPLSSKVSFSCGEQVASNSSNWFAAFDGFGPLDCDGIHMSSCGHAMHLECRDRYLSSLRERYRRNVYEGGYIVNPDQGEFLCPVCRRLANSVLPAFPDHSCKVTKQIMSSDLSSTQTAGSSTISHSEVNIIRLQQALYLLQSTANMVGKGGILKALPLQQNKTMRPTLEPLFSILCRLYFPDSHDKFSVPGRISHSMIMWDTLKYSLISTEIACRGRSYMCSGGSTSGLAALYKELESSTGFIFSLLLQVVQSTRSENSLQVLLRFRGVQLLAESICSGVSMDEFSIGTVRQRGDMSSILKHVDKGVVYPDTQFWKRAADPVIAHDPFSSLMWVLFCLPCPFLSSMESFLSLVHLFYVVCVIQAIITSCGRHQLDLTVLEFGDCLISDICKIIGESVVAQEYFVSNYIDSSCHPKEMIRRLSFPYLRRCALLWKLLNSSKSAPFCDTSRGENRSSHTNNYMYESTSDISMELKEVEELENMFKIPSLDVVFKDAVLHALVLRWIHHFCKEFEFRSYGHVLHSTPAIPFKLMLLPHVYQDLLQRYIKQQCPDCKAALYEAALCLLCGRLCSPRWKSCCRESSCQSHVVACGAGIGVFLLIRRTTILLQRSTRQTPWPSLYLDSFGEEDIDLNRGKPLYLNEERYAALNHIVASHGLDRSSEVLRQTTIDLPVMI